MSEIVDKRRQMTPEKLENLRKMREKAAEANRLKKQQRLEADENKAKMEVLSAIEKPVEEKQEIEPEPEYEPEPEPQIKVTKPKPKKPEISHGYVNDLDLSPEDLKYVKELALERKNQAKQKKWESRKSEILSELIERINPSKPQKQQQQPTEPSGGWNLFE